MKSRPLIVAFLIAIVFLASCVNVTTERKDEPARERPCAKEFQTSNVKVRSFGWDALEALGEIIVLPFRIVYLTVRMVI